MNPASLRVRSFLSKEEQMRRWAYDLMYRVWAPWDSVGVRDDLRGLLESGQ